MKKIYVGNLPFSASDDEIRSLFSEYGTVESVALITDRDTGRPRGFGFVEMADGADEAIQALHRELYKDDTPSAQDNFRRFHTYLLGQMSAIRERSGCDEVSFRVAQEDGALKLKAKPVRHVRLSAPGGTESG